MFKTLFNPYSSLNLLTNPIFSSPVRPRLKNFLKGLSQPLMTDQLLKFPNLLLVVMNRCLLPKYLRSFLRKVPFPLVDGNWMHAIGPGYLAYGLRTFKNFHDHLKLETRCIPFPMFNRHHLPPRKGFLFPLMMSIISRKY